MKSLPLLLTFLLFIPSLTLAETHTDKPYDEMPFLEQFAGKTAEYVRQELGKPDSIAKKENTSGTIEFWVYNNLVKQANSEKIYRYTQIGIVNNYVETLGHTNREMK